MYQAFGRRPAYLRLGLPRFSVYLCGRCRTGNRAVGLPPVPPALCCWWLIAIPVRYWTSHSGGDLTSSIGAGVRQAFLCTVVLSPAEETEVWQHQLLSPG